MDLRFIAVYNIRTDEDYPYFTNIQEEEFAGEIWHLCMR